MIFSIIFYLFFASILFTLGRLEWLDAQAKYYKSGIYSKTMSFHTVILLTIFILVCAVRYKVGVDCESYVDHLKVGKPSSPQESLELFYRWIVEGLHGLNASRVTFLGLLAALEIIPFYYALRSRKYLYPYIGFLLIMGPFYLYWMNGIRQSIAACFFVLASSILVDTGFKGRLLASLIILFAAQFHTSAYFLLVFLFLPIWDWFRFRYVNIAILLFCVIVGQTEFAKNYIMEFAASLNLNSFAYEGYIDSIEDMLNEETGFNFGPRRIVILLLTLITLWFAPNIKEKMNDKFFLYSFNLFFLHVCLNDSLLLNLYHVFKRPFYYTQPFELICFAYLLYYLNELYKGKYKRIIYLITFILSAMYMILECIAVSSNPYETSLYKFYVGQ